MLDDIQSTPLLSGLVRLAITVPYLSIHAWWYPIQPPLQSCLVRLAITVPSLSIHAWCCPIHPHINQVLCIWPLQCLLCQVMLDDIQSTPTSIRYCASGHYSAFSVKSCLMLSNPPHFNQVLCVWPLQCLLCQVMLDAGQSTPTSIRSCASGHYSAFSVKSCLMLSNPPPPQSDIVHLAITVPSLSNHAWYCPIHPRFNQVSCVWPSWRLLCQVMVDAVQSTPASIRSCASGQGSAFSVLSSHYWCSPIHPHFNQVLCVWPLQCLLCQVMLDAVQSTPASIRYCASGHYSAFSVKSCLMLANPPSALIRSCASGHYSALSVKLCFDVVQSTPASIRSCASGHYSAFSV